MNIVIDRIGVRVVNPRDLRSFAIIIMEGINPTSILAEYAAAGALSSDGRHMFVDPDWIRRNVVGLADDPAWLSEFDAMVRYAASKGWADDLGRIRGHISSETINESSCAAAVQNGNQA